MKDEKVPRSIRGFLGKSSPVKLVITGVLCLVVPIILCLVFVGPQKILEYASESRPYSVFLAPQTNATVNQEESGAKVICLGDSNFFYPYHHRQTTDDTDTYLSTLMAEMMRKIPESPKMTISQRAFPGATAFDYYCMLYEVEKHSPDLVVIPINWRTFGGQWINSPTSYHPELSAFVPLRERFDSNEDNPLKLKGISPVKQLEYKMQLYFLYPVGIKTWALDNMKSFVAVLSEKINPSAFAAGMKMRDTVPAVPKKGLKLPGVENVFFVDAAMNQSNFPVEVTATNPTLRDLSAAADTAERGGTKVLFFIWPLDGKHVSAAQVDDLQKLERSKETVVKMVTRKNTTVVDLSGLLTSEYFWDNLGHCRVAGREKIAEALAPAIIDLLNKDAQPQS